MRIILVGTDTPIQKVLYEIPIQGLQFPVLYTEIGQNKKIEKKAQQLYIELEDINCLTLPNGQENLRRYKPDWLFSINSTIVFPKSILTIPKYGCINMHPGKLPEYAGLHTHQWAIRNGEEKFAATLHWMESKVDTGPIVFRKEIDISPKDTGLSLFMKCLDVGTELTLKAFEEIADGKLLPKIEQDLSKRKVYRHKDALNGKIRWNLTAKQIADFIRAADYAPFKSPTYSPSVQFGDMHIVVRKAEMENTPGGMPGEVIDVNDKGILVATKDNKSVLFTVVEQQNKVFSGKQISEVLKIHLGGRLV